MPLRLIVELDGGTARFALAEGESLVGSAAGCDVRIAEPTVSRQHARLRVSGQQLRIDDLDSRNGTWVDGIRLDGSWTGGVGADLRFGRVRAWLEAAPCADTVAGAGGHGGAAAGSADDQGSTFGVVSLAQFADRELGPLMDIAREADQGALALAAGHALLRCFPALGLRLSRGVEPARCILFESSPGAAPGTPEVALDHAGLCAGLHGEQRESREARSAVNLVLRLLALATPRDPESATQRGRAPGASAPDSLSPAMQALYREAAVVARSTLSVLIRGETGSGKELLARFLHDAGDRDGPLLAINCAALPRDLLELELFGIEGNVATGVRARPGKFEQADGGTLFLDEIGELGADVQAKLLRVLESGEVLRLGATHPRPARARVVSATHADIEAEVAAGRFRRDLFHRIADWVAVLPPLRERAEDIPNLALGFLDRELARRGVRGAGISRAALDLLLAYDWPGNVRELEREMARGALFVTDGQMLDQGLLSPRLAGVHAGTAGAVPDGAPSRPLDALADEAIQRAVEDCGGNISEAARRLGISRSRVYRRLRRGDVAG